MTLISPTSLISTVYLFDHLQGVLKGMTKTELFFRLTSLTEQPVVEEPKPLVNVGQDPGVGVDVETVDQLKTFFKHGYNMDKAGSRDGLVGPC